MHLLKLADKGFDEIISLFNQRLECLIELIFLKEVDCLVSHSSKPRNMSLLKAYLLALPRYDFF